MSVTVRVYGDEAGTMPVRDEDDVFIAATFAIVGDVGSTVPDKRSNAPWTAKHLSSLKAQATCALVKPSVGYGVALAKKVDGLNQMAQETKIRTGRNSQYVPQGGFSARNMIWGYAMEIALGTSIPMLVLHAGCVPDRVDVYLDEKTMPAELRHLFRKRGKDFGITVSKAIRQVASTQEGQRRELLEAFAGATAVNPEFVTVQWSDEPGFAGNQKGLALADSLASNLYKELRNSNPVPGFSQLLKEAGCRAHINDSTARVLSPPPREIIEKWEQATGCTSPF